MALERSEKRKLLAALALFGLAAFGFARFFWGRSSSDGLAYFYDLSAKKLFVAPHSSVPPIQGKYGPEQDGVRAVVITFGGDPRREEGRQIAYLETYAPELKEQIESRQKAGAVAAENQPRTIGRGQAQSFTWIKRPDEGDWHPMDSPEAQRILQILTRPGPNGSPPLVCAP